MALVISSDYSRYPRKFLKDSVVCGTANPESEHFGQTYISGPSRIVNDPVFLNIWPSGQWEWFYDIEHKWPTGTKDIFSFIPESWLELAE